MTRESERKKAMMEKFMELHQSGLTIAEIADNYRLSKSVVYKSLQQIADANGVTRESLLQVVMKPREETLLKQEAKQVRLDTDELRKSFAEVRQAIDGLLDQVNQKIQQVQEEI